MEIHWFDHLGSTQSHLLDALRSGTFTPPVCIGASLQTMGKGSRGNGWIGEEGNLFISVAVERSSLPKDLKLESASIYFAFLMKELLATEYGSSVWLKWPNDFYFGEDKCGGVITNLLKETLVCGIGINLVSAPAGYARIEPGIVPYELTKNYCAMFKNLPSWKQIFSKYRLEFENSRTYFTHHNHEKVALERAILMEDGSLECDGQRIFSLR